MAVQCWADSLGNCSDVQSREHYISKGLFEGDSVNLKGLPWCQTQEKTIGLASAASKILCKTHNEALSDLDAEAIRTFDCLRELQRLRSVQERLPPRIWRVRESRLDGRLLERWFLKTLVNLVQVQGQEVSWPDGTAPRVPTVDVVGACFGLVPIKSPRGLHAAAAVGHLVDSRDYVSFAPIIDTSIRALAGGAFEFRGLRFVFAWTERPLEGYINLLAHLNPAYAGWRGAKLLHPFRGMNSDVGPHRSSVVRIVWPPFRACARP